LVCARGSLEVLIVELRPRKLKLELLLFNIFVDILDCEDVNLVERDYVTPQFPVLKISLNNHIKSEYFSKECHISSLKTT